MQGQRRQVVLDSEDEKAVGPLTKKARMASLRQGGEEDKQEEW